MSCIWQEISGQPWRAEPVLTDKLLRGERLGVPGLIIFGLAHGAERGALLMARPGLWVRVNGLPVLGCLHVLEHKDEILVASQRFYFSLETKPVIATYHIPEGSRAAICPICRGPIKDGSTAVQCPACSRWYHQIDATEGRQAKPCWTYAPTCRFCSHPTAFDAEASWRPDLEEAHA
jgi:hypothetical protein